MLSDEQKLRVLGYKIRRGKLNHKAHAEFDWPCLNGAGQGTVPLDRIPRPVPGNPGPFIPLHCAFLAVLFGR